MADTQAADSLIKREPEVPATDPIVSRSTSGVILVSVLLMMASVIWSLYDETYGQRPWKSMQRQFVARYTNYLKGLKEGAGESEASIKERPEYKALDDKAKAAHEKVKGDIDEIRAKLKKIQPQLDAITDPFQNQRGHLMVTNYNVELAHSDAAKEKYRAEAKRQRDEPVEVEMPDDDGKIKVEHLKYDELEKRYNSLREQRAALLGQQAEKSKEPSELDKQRDDYLKNQLLGLGPIQLDSLIAAQDKFDYSILGHQINVPEFNVVDRCEVCHLGMRTPLGIDLTAENMKLPDQKPDALAKAFVSHPNRELLETHKLDKFGCSGCHWGNGRATTNEEKGHGGNEHWLWPLFAKENVEAGCQQCHAKDRITVGAENVNLGRDLFYVRGCVGCHRYEGFDREADALNNARQSIKQLEDQIVANEKAVRADAAASTVVSSNKEGKEGDEAKALQNEMDRLRDHQQSLTLTSSLLAARIDQLNLATKYLMQDQKKVGPNLKDVRLKLRRDWIPIWLKEPQNFRHGTKMPSFWRFGKDKHGDDEIKAISAYLWQSGFEGKVPEQQKGDANHGKEVFEGRGCLACHSIGEGGNRVGGMFAANLTKVAAKANFDYMVRWIYNPRARYAPYCPKEKRDLTAEDYTKHGKPYIFDTELHSKCPNDGAELQVQNMTVMPDFRLSEQDARDVATYLFSLSSPESYADASYMDSDTSLKESGRTLIKQFGCAGCHEIKGFEEEQRIGKELTVEGATPIERLDFALHTKDAEEGHDPAQLHENDSLKGKPWYNARGFFEHKLNEPGFYDEGKEKAEADWLRMPKPYLNPEWRTALTTFLLGSVGAEGANVSRGLFYEPQDQRRQDIQAGWWLIKKYNCTGCHAIQPGQRMVVAKGENDLYLDGSVLMNLPQYAGDLKDTLPPRLTSEGARVDPNWLLRFLKDPSMGEGKPGPAPAGEAKTAAAADQSNGKLVEQPGLNRNGVRPYLQARMPTFNFSPDELQTLVRFFVALSGQDTPYIKDKLEPLTDSERLVARQIFTNGTPCLKCHITGEPTHDAKASAPNFLLASERLKPEWTFRWLRDPAQIAPGTAMPSGLFKKDADRWIVNNEKMPKDVNDYHGDHAWLLVRYMFLMTPDENSRLLSTSPAPPPTPAAAAPAPAAPKPTGQTGWYKPDRSKTVNTVAQAARRSRSPG